jgi:hypothetical protein
LTADDESSLRPTTGCDEPPSELSNRARARVVPEGKPAHRAVDPVRTDDEVVFIRAFVVELDGNRPVSLVKRTDANPHPDRCLPAPSSSAAWKICAMERTATMERTARPDAVPQRRYVDLEEQPAASVAEALLRDRHGPVDDGVLEPERAKRPSRVAGQVDASACVAPRRLALDELGHEAGATESSRRRETRDAGAHDEHARV